MGVLLPAARGRIRGNIARTSLGVDRIEREIERLAGFLGEGLGIDGLRVQREHGAVGRVDAAPGLLIFILLVTHPDAEFHVREVVVDEFEQGAGIGAPFKVERLPFLKQVSREIQGRPRGSIGGRVMIFEKLGQRGDHRRPHSVFDAA